MENLRFRFPAVLLALLFIAACGALAADYKIGWYSINSGGGLGSSASYRVNATVGQAAAGFVQSASFLHWIGFWAGGVPTPTVAANLNAAKALPDGTFVSVAGKIATSASGDFANFFYIEEEGRFAGIRVAAPPGPIAGLARGSVVNVLGTLGTTAAGERQLTGPIVAVVSTHAPLKALSMNNRLVGGGDLGTPPLGEYGVTGLHEIHNVGLLIQSWGWVTEVGSGYVMISDGATVGGTPTPVRVDTTTLASPPGRGRFVYVVGISSLYKPGSDRLRLILPRNDADITGP